MPRLRVVVVVVVGLSFSHASCGALAAAIYARTGVGGPKSMTLQKKS